MADVAARAGVSVATVSKVVNQRYGVAKATVDRVNAVIEELEYVGNLSASSLRSHTTNVLGILVADFEPYSAELIKGASTVTRLTNYELLAHSGGEAHAWERRSIARLGGTLIDGAVVVTPTTLDAVYAVPVVAVDPHYGPNLVATVDSDSWGGARDATQYLIELGHTRIGFLGGREELDSSRQRASGYREAVRNAGIGEDEALVRYSRYDPDVAETEAEAMLAIADPPTAIFASNDVTAMRVIKVAARLGLRVPEDLSVVGFDDIPEASLSAPPLTTVRQPLQAMGAAAMEMLLRLLSGEPGETHIRMDTELVVRGTTAPPRTSKR